MTTPRHVELLRGCGALVMAEAVHSSTSNIARLIDCTGHPELCSRLLKGKKIYCIKNKYINNNY